MLTFEVYTGVHVGQAGVGAFVHSLSKQKQNYHIHKRDGYMVGIYTGMNGEGNHHEIPPGIIRGGVVAVCSLLAQQVHKWG